MQSKSLEVLNILSTPVWVVSTKEDAVVFANSAARTLSDVQDLAALRHGAFSAHAQTELSAYLPALAADHHIVEIWTLQKAGSASPLSCRLTLAREWAEQAVIIAEGQPSVELLPDQARCGQEVRCGKQPYSSDRGFHDRLFSLNAAPMLLIDPTLEGRIVDANLAARFYGYSRDQMCRMHTWEINTLGRDVLPVMQEVAKLPGGHKPLNFEHRLANGTTRHVQTHAGTLELEGRHLMLAIIHDITEQKRLEQELELAALRDPLTGLWNRRQFLTMVEQVHKHSQHNEKGYSMMLIDADHFKVINDQFGHHTGDAVLIQLARILEKRVRDSDSVCRWGGEEFVVLLPHTDLDGALALAEAVRETVAALAKPNLPRLTVSIGVAAHQATEDTDQLFMRVDEALYRAKASGRNTVCSA